MGTIGKDPASLFDCKADGCKQTFESLTGMRRHYGASHEGTLSGRETTCASCERSFVEKNWEERTYCSVSCRDA